MSTTVIRIYRDTNAPPVPITFADADLTDSEVELVLTPASGAPWFDPGIYGEPPAPKIDVFGQPWCPMCEHRPSFDEPAGGEALRPNAVILTDRPVMPEGE